jgi:hypothetical protein
MRKDNGFKIMFSIGIIGILLGIVFSKPVLFGLCQSENSYSCIGYYANNFGFDLLLWSLTIIISTLLLKFIAPSALKIWATFALIYILISQVLIFLTPVTCGSLICFDRQMVTWLSAAAFLVISMIIIIYKKIKEVKQN